MKDKHEKYLENLKIQLQNQPDFSFNAAFQSLDKHGKGNISVDDIRDFQKQNGYFSTEREIDGVIRRLDTTGDSCLNFSEFSFFL